MVGVEHHHFRPLGELGLKRRDVERSLQPVRVGCTPYDRIGTVRSVLQSVAELLGVILKSLAEVWPTSHRLCRLNPIRQEPLRKFASPQKGNARD